jgi:hypothetical protein
MAADTPFTLSGALALPPDTGQPQVSIPFSGSQNFKTKASGVFNLTGAGTQAVDFGTIPAAGIKALLVEVDPDASGSLAAIILAINGSATGKIEVTPGGFLAYFNPAPAAGITALDLEHTTANCVRVWLLGD